MLQEYFQIFFFPTFVSQIKVKKHKKLHTQMVL